MDDWFQRFAGEAIAVYGKLNESVAKVAEGEDWLAAIRDERVLNPTSIGKEGESLVVEEMQRKGYSAITSPGSRSPVDVWAVGSTPEGVLHLALLQVKTTYKKDTAAHLSADEETRVSKFCSFVGGFIPKSAHFPESLKRSQTLVSCAYAGVVIDWPQTSSFKFDVRTIDAVSTFIQDKDRQAWANWLDDFYIFGGAVNAAVA